MRHTLLLTLLFATIAMFSQQVKFDGILRTDKEQYPDQRYYLYDQDGNLLSERKLSNNTTVFASRYDAERFVVEVKQNNELVGKWHIVPNELPDTVYIVDSTKRMIPYFLNESAYIDSSNVISHRKINAFKGYATFDKEILETGIQPIRGFGAIKKGIIRYSNTDHNLVRFGWEVAESDFSGKIRWESYWAVDQKWHGIVIEKNWVWINSVLMLKPSPEPTNPIDGMIYMDMNHNLKVRQDGIWETFLTTKSYQTLKPE